MFKITAAAGVAAMISIMSVNAEEDPYLWLEEVEGEKALDWGARRKMKLP